MDIIDNDSIISSTTDFDLTNSVFLDIVKRLFGGQVFTNILYDLRIEPYKFHNALIKSPDHEDYFLRVREKTLELRADRLLEAHNGPCVTRARLETDNLKWLLTKRLPSKFGDRIAVDVNAVDISQALLEAKARKKQSLPINDLDNIIEIDSVVITDTKKDNESDKTSLVKDKPLEFDNDKDNIFS